MKLCVIAGKGEIVPEVLNAIKSTTPLVISIDEDPEYNYHYKLSPFKVGKILDTLKRENITHVLFVGKVERKKIFEAFKLDFTALKVVATLRDFSDDTIMEKVIEILTKEGIKIVKQKDLLKEFIAKEGEITGKLKKNEKEEIKFGFKIAKELGRLGIGQTVVIKRKSVIAVEAIEGTDKTILRAGEYVKNFIVIKVKRPVQKDYMDLPVVGTRTLEVMKEAGGKILAVEAGETLIIGKGFKEKAKEYGIKVVAVSENTYSCS